ncbi:hypothetical protein NPS29_00935 [Pseudomonas putida]|uniref:DUF6957 family protein n=1 Tax=Pseudomonas putida TaxID=303 RepID=UPI00236335CE|nr:hypothetical protein [Pseudomonas putida]MDD1963874.1 hypothetical protein [Pseudomonas putida]
MMETDLYRLLELSGDQVEGATYADAERLKELGARTWKPHCVLYSWIVLDLVDGDVADLILGDQASDIDGRQADPQHGDAAASSHLPIVLFGHYVEFHSAGEYGKGSVIRTGPAVEYDGRGIFETEDTIFVLLGKGYRRPASVELVNSLPLGVIPEDHPVRKRERPRGGVASARQFTDVIYCDLQMSHTQGHELLALVAKLRSSGSYPGLESVFIDIERELSHSTLMVESAPFRRR